MKTTAPVLPEHFPLQKIVEARNVSISSRNDVFVGKDYKITKKYLENMKKCVPLHPQFRKMVAIDKFGAVVQLVRIPACHAGGRGFESLPHRKQLF